MEKGQTCCKCGNQASMLWPTYDMGIEPDYYCIAHLHEAKMEFLEKLYVS